MYSVANIRYLLDSVTSLVNIFGYWSDVAEDMWQSQLHGLVSTGKISDDDVNLAQCIAFHDGQVDIGRIEKFILFLHSLNITNCDCDDISDEITELENVTCDYVSANLVRKLFGLRQRVRVKVIRRRGNKQC